MAISGPEAVKIIQEAAVTVLAALVTFLVTMFSLPLFVAVFAQRQMLKWYLKHHQSGRFVLMSPVDTVCSLETPPKTLGHATYMIASTNKPFDITDLEKLRSKISQQLSTKMYQKLNYRACVKLGFFCWEDLRTNSCLIDINNHVKLCPGADSWNKVYSESEMMMALENAVNMDMDVSMKPTWEVLVVPQVKIKIKASKPVSQTQVALVVKMGHGYMDGRSLKEFFQRCVFDEDLLQTVNQPSVVQKENLFQIVKGLLSTVFDQVKETICHHGSKISKQSSSDLHRIAHIKFDSKTVSRIRWAFKCETLAVFCNALMVALKQLADRKGVVFPGSLNVAVTSKLNLPPFTGEPSNFFNVYTQCIPMRGFDIGKQLVDANEKLLNIPINPNYGGFRLFQLSGSFPVAWIRFFTRVSGFRSISITTFPTSEQTFRFHGGDVVSLVTIVRPVYGIVCALSSIYYGGSFNVGLAVSDIELVNDNLDMAELTEYFREHIDRLEQIASDKGSIPRRKNSF